MRWEDFFSQYIWFNFFVLHLVWRSFPKNSKKALCATTAARSTFSRGCSGWHNTPASSSLRWTPWSWILKRIQTTKTDGFQLRQTQYSLPQCLWVSYLLIYLSMCQVSYSNSLIVISYNFMTPESTWSVMNIWSENQINQSFTRHLTWHGGKNVQHCFMYFNLFVKEQDLLTNKRMYTRNRKLFKNTHVIYIKYNKNKYVEENQWKDLLWLHTSSDLLKDTLV